MGLLVRPHIPYHLRRCPWNDAIRRADRICVAVVADSRDGEVCRCREHGCEIPAKGDELARGYLEKGRRGLLGLCD